MHSHLNTTRDKHKYEVLTIASKLCSRSSSLAYCMCKHDVIFEQDNGIPSTLPVSLGKQNTNSCCIQLHSDLGFGITYRTQQLRMESSMLLAAANYLFGDRFIGCFT